MSNSNGDSVVLDAHGNGAFRPSVGMLGWALNEEESLDEYVERAEAFLKSISDDYELVIIDDGSTDSTWAVLQRLCETRPWLRIFQNDRNRGAGYCTKRALSLGTKDYLFWQTVDWSYDITELGRSLAYLQHYDVLQGVRDGTVSWSGLLSQRSDTAYKGLVSIANYLLIRVLFQLPMRDYQNVTVYPRHLIQSVTLEAESAFTNPECLLKTWWKGARFKEVPVPFLKRTRGVAKGTRPRAVLAAVRDVFYWWCRWIVLGKREDRGRGTVAGLREERAITGDRRPTEIVVVRPTEELVAAAVASGEAPNGATSRSPVNGTSHASVGLVKQHTGDNGG